MLNELKRPVWSKRKSLQIGRGNGTGVGNYSTRGHKGQRARSGFSQKPGFEGGQTPLHMRLPKARGFKRYFKLVNHTTPLNIGTLNSDDRIKANDVLTAESLYTLGYGKIGTSFKILGSGEITKSLSFEGLAISSSAKSLIEKAGGSVA